jgi:hypothetical protein
VEAELDGLKTKRTYYQLLQLDDESLDRLICEHRRGLQSDPVTVRATLGRIVKAVEAKSDGGTLHVRFPQQSFLTMPPR